MKGIIERTWGVVEGSAPVMAFGQFMEMGAYFRRLSES